MKIVTIGLSPFLLTSRSRLHAEVLQHLYLTGHQVAGVVWGHNCQYFVPEEENGEKVFYYPFEHNSRQHKIPIVPFVRNTRESVSVYEILKDFSPDIVVLIGEIGDFPYMHAVRMFYDQAVEIVLIFTNYGLPIHESYREILDGLDGVLCTSKNACQNIQSLCPNKWVDFAYVGCDLETYRWRPQWTPEPPNLRLMSCAKNEQSDNGPLIMQSVAELRLGMPYIELYLHTNHTDPGEHDLSILRQRFDPDDKFILLPAKSVSLLEGVSDDELAEQFSLSSIFVSVPMVSATSMGVFQALACGCYPILSDCGCNREIADLLAIELNLTRDDFLVPCIELLTVGETYLSVCSRESLKEKIMLAHRKIKKNEGLKQGFVKFTQKYSRNRFREKVSELIASIQIEHADQLRLDRI